MFDIKESTINKIFEGKSFSKKFGSRNFSCQPILLLLGAGIKCFDIPISDVDCVTILIYYFKAAQYKMQHKQKISKFYKPNI